MRESPKAQEMGPKKYREMMHKANKKADDNPNLPFKILKPRRKVRNNKAFECTCGKIHWLNKTTYMVSCQGCHTLVKVEDMQSIEDIDNKDTQIIMNNHKGVDQKPGPFTKL